MAKSKEKFISLEMSQAFIDKTKQEIQRLKESVAHSLKNDINSLFDDELHSDLVITNGTDVIFAHKCIVKARCRELWQDNWVTKTFDPDGNEVDCIEIAGLNGNKLEEFIRHLYVVNDSLLLLKEYLHCLPGQQKSESGVIFPEEVDDFRPDLSSKEVPQKGNTHILPPEQSCVLVSVKTEFKTSESDLLAAVPLSSSVRDDSSSDLNLMTGSGTVKSSDSPQLSHIPDSSDLLSNSFNSIDQELASLNWDVDLKCSQVLPSESDQHSAQVVSNNNNNICNEDLKTNSIALCGDTSNATHDVDHVNNDSSDPPKIDSNGNADSKQVQCTKEEQESTQDSLVKDTVKESESLSVPYDTCSSLGRDLLQLYIEETNCDCCLAVDGIRFMVHKCVLSARSEYFQAMLGGQWCESKMEAINLEGVTPQAVEQLLLFLYGGVLEIATPCELTDLFVAADMYGILSLKKVLAFYVRKDLCHFFHKPCFVCTGKAPEALSLCYNFNMSNLQDRVVRWVGKYFTKIWPTKSFASLPDNVQDLSVEGIKSQMTTRNVLDIIMECNKLITSLPRIKWTESILCLLTQLMDTSIEFTSSHFIEVISTQEFQQWAKVASWKAGVLEDIFNTVIDSLPINMSCQVYETLTHLEAVLSEQDSSDVDVVGLLQAMIKRCEKFFKTHINQVMRTKDWAQLPKPVQSKILENSAYMFLGDAAHPSKKSKAASKSKEQISAPGNKKLQPRGGKTVAGGNVHAAGGDNGAKSAHPAVKLRSKGITQQKERPKSSITISEQAKKASVSEKTSSSKSTAQPPKSRYTIASFGFRRSVSHSHSGQGDANQSAVDAESILKEMLGAETAQRDLAACDQELSSAAISTSQQHSETTEAKSVPVDSNRPAPSLSLSSSSGAKLLPSKIPLSVRSPKASRPKYILKNELSGAKQKDAQNGNASATPVQAAGPGFVDAIDGEADPVGLKEADEVFEQEMKSLSGGDTEVDMVSSITWSEKSEMTESTASLSACGPSVESMSPEKPTSVVQLTPDVEPKLIVEPTPVVKPKPIVEPTHVVEPKSTVEPTPPVEAKPSVEPTPVVESKPSVEQMPIVGLKPLVEPSPHLEPIPTVEPTPLVKPKPAVEPTNVVEPKPTVEPTHVVEPKPTVESTPLVKPKPAVQPTPVESKPTVEQRPIAEPKPTVEPIFVMKPNSALEPTHNFEPTAVVELKLAVEPKLIVEPTPAAGLNINLKLTTDVEPKPAEEPKIALEPTLAMELELAVEPTLAVEPKPTEELTTAVEPKNAVGPKPTVEPKPPVELNKAIEPTSAAETKNAVDPNNAVRTIPAVKPTPAADSQLVVKSTSIVEPKKAVKPTLVVKLTPTVEPSPVVHLTPAPETNLDEEGDDEQTEEPQVNVVTMSKTLNVGFSVPPE